MPRYKIKIAKKDQTVEISWIEKKIKYQINKTQLFFVGKNNIIKENVSKRYIEPDVLLSMNR
ncbi:MAG: hypothetical protein MJA31_01760 [Clostridia bacterium]|nr:hypothetical protein [Clostridia bacterium]